MIVIESAGITDVGMKREGNEDSYLVDDDSRFYIVADGMGGHQAGEVASALVIDTMQDYMKRFEEDGNAEELDDIDETLSKPANRILASIQLANKAVHDIASSKETYSGMGSTVAAAMFTEDALIIANVGDSPVYLVHNGSIEMLSVIHNVITEQMAINPEAAKTIGLQYRNLLTRGMGIKPTVEPDVCEIQYFTGDMVIISSDGLTDKVNEEEILEVANREPPDKACKKLVDLANKRGGEDNITVIILKVLSVKDGKSGIMGMISKLFNPFKKIFK